jgi:hypothetical protein
MPITLTPINGTDSIAGSRITVNDNFAVIEDALNKVLQVFNIATGKINNYGFGTDNDIETEDLIVRGSTGGGVSVLSGNVSLVNGNIQVSGYLEFGAGTNTKLEKVLRNFAIAPGNIPTFNMSGTGSTGSTGPVGYLAIPRLDTATINDIKFPFLGALVADVSGATAVLKMCYQSGTTGSWIAIT